MKRYPTFLLALLFPITMYGQQNLTADELFVKARNTAFEQKDYTTSIALAKEALEKAPNYTDISVFLGRLYTWNKDLAAASPTQLWIVWVSLSIMAISAAGQSVTRHAVSAKISNWGSFSRFKRSKNSSFLIRLSSFAGIGYFFIYYFKD
ncbi:tetratricopeptide repeat protein [Chryseobacterium sp. MA9]|uniref:tetratricopeptide repeat protein n=1 Tax=Chryseobacterium sp. MA9 TaxID=2966625 RepID=UPI0021083C81|nr:tetratricopeptide repeat protein [Chryseobacterium sp. MA9]UTX49583.1 tetratricopeptide repeat protein [Chryseobacterium sp. MA9]